MYLLNHFYLDINTVRITGFGILPDQEDPVGICCSKDVYEYVRANIMYGILTHHPEILGKNLKVSDIKFEKQDMLTEVKKGTANYVLKHTAEPYMDYAYFIEAAEFIETAMTLAAHGHFITHENKEDKYIDIINEGQPHVINALENYLYLKEHRTGVSTLHKKYLVVKKEIANASNIEEVAEVLEQHFPGVVMLDVIYSNNIV